MSEELDRYIHEINQQIHTELLNCEDPLNDMNYAENISHAMKAVDEMKKKGFHWEGGNGYKHSAKEECWSMFEKEGDRSIFFEGTDEKLEMAICLAVKEYLDSEGKETDAN